jgi:hypothetical protein
MKKIFYLPFVALITTFYCYSSNDNIGRNSVLNENFVYNIPLAGNAYSSNPFANTNTITEIGIENWSNSQEYFTAYFRISEPGNLELSLTNNAVKSLGKSTLEFTINGLSKKIQFDEANKNHYPIGTWKINKAGYVAVIIKGITKEKSTFPSISSLTVTTHLSKEKIAFVQDKGASYFYWSKRGPYVVLSYPIQEDINYEWFYNEVTVPKGSDFVGSYFATSGCSEAYFGMQVNSDVERRILFSVWSPFTTDNPQTIPESKRVQLLKKGEGVTVGEFGGEGSGGQSYFKYNWKAGSTYKFLLHAIPQPNNFTRYSAYFFAPESNEWKLIASFSRPETQTYLKGLYSFLENFMPEQGNLTREVFFDNQWVCDQKGNWTEINKAQFMSQDIGQVGNTGDRMDFSGGVKNQSFFLKHCGFFDSDTPKTTVFKRPLANKKPIIDFAKLP